MSALIVRSRRGRLMAERNRRLAKPRGLVSATLARQGLFGCGRDLADARKPLANGVEAGEIEYRFVRRPLPVEDPDRESPTLRQRLQELQDVASEGRGAAAGGGRP